MASPHRQRGVLRAAVELPEQHPWAGYSTRALNTPPLSTGLLTATTLGSSTLGSSTTRLASARFAKAPEPPLSPAQRWARSPSPTRGRPLNTSTVKTTSNLTATFLRQDKLEDYVPPPLPESTIRGHMLMGWV
mmetsp:Transcript_4835/g.16673  ORF Transcript_4835/g.16673 Transcript_4835/m.16673 type:complete len:133 (+) Transcript_4835:18-416(+)